MFKKLCLSLVLVLLAAAAYAAEPLTAPVSPQDVGGEFCAAQIDPFSPAGLPEPHFTAGSPPHCTSPLCRTVDDCFGFPCGPNTFCMGATPYTCGTCQCY